MMGSVERATGTTVDIPDAFVNVGGPGYGLWVPETLGFDPTANEDGTLGGNMALGEDIYLYAVHSATDDGRAEIVASLNATTPTGYTANNSRRIAGFHYGRVRPIAQRYSSGYTCPTEVIPNSVWDLQHRPKCEPSGMVEVIEGSRWVDIYLGSEAGTWPDSYIVSEYNATPVTGSEGYALQDYWRMARNAGKDVIADYGEFRVLAYGVPQGATGASGRTNTGQHSGYGFDCVSCLNVDQPSGNIWQVTRAVFDRGDSADGWNDNLNAGKDSGYDVGQWYGGDLRLHIVGARWTYASEAGAGAVSRGDPWHVASGPGVRGACDSLRN